jgi:hypothetical protein
MLEAIDTALQPLVTASGLPIDQVWRITQVAIFCCCCF